MKAVYAQIGAQREAGVLDGETWNIKTHIANVPIGGSCETFSPSPALTPCDNRPQFWDGPRVGQPAQWTCGWCTNAGAVNVPGARAWICCVRL